MWSLFHFSSEWYFWGHLGQKYCVTSFSVYHRIYNLSNLANLFQKVPGSYNVQAVDANNSTSAVEEVKIDDVLEPIILDLMIKTNTREVIKAEERLPVQSEFPQKSSRGFLRGPFRGR
jgi:hypothetical protein